MFADNNGKNGISHIFLAPLTFKKAENTANDNEDQYWDTSSDKTLEKRVK